MTDAIKPVAWMYECKERGIRFSIHSSLDARKGWDVTPLYAAPQADRVKALEAENERLHAVVAAFNNGMPPMTTKDAADALEKLVRYSEHKVGCDAREWENLGDCTCGLTKLLEEIAGD